MEMDKPVVLVTGAAGGIGSASVRDLLAHGYRVAALDVSAAALAKALPKGSDELETIEGDVSDEASCANAVAKAVSRFGRLDALIHYGAIHSTKTWRDLTPDEFNRVLAVNVTGSFLIARAAADHMAARGGGGAIVLTASGSIYVSGVGGGSGRGGPAYVTSTAAILGLMRALARSLGPQGIRVNAVSPGSVETPMIAGYDEAARRGVRDRTPLGRIGEAAEIASVARFLISADAAYMTGEVVNVNGGGSMT
jgi:NAD(P)-dependent dehydrogenase (short-subunit alcohol dehydrogenase family)